MGRVTGRLRAATRPRLEGLVAALGEDDVFARRFREAGDLGPLVDLAFQEGVGALVLERASALRLHLPADLRTEMEHRRARDRLWHRRLAAVQDEVLGACEGAVVLKGPLLGERLYPDASLRPAADVDLLVDPEEMESTCRALERLGFQAEGPWRYHHVRLLRGDEHVELHDAASSGPGTEIPARPLIEASRPYGKARILSPADELVYLAVHAARHRLSRLVWLYDVRLFLERHPRLDYGAVAERARSFGVVNAVSVTAEALRRRLGTALPDGLRRVLRRGLAVRLAAGFLSRDVDRFFLYSRLSAIGRETYVALLPERRTAGLRYWLGCLAEATRKVVRASNGSRPSQDQ